MDSQKLITSSFMVLIIIGCLFLNQFLAGTIFEKFYNQEGKPVLIFFSLDGCPHCDRVKPAYKELSSNKSVNCVNVEAKNRVFRDLDENDIEVPYDGWSKGTPNELIKKYEGQYIQGYPTFLLVKSNNEVIPYEGERSLDGFTTFINANV